MAKVALAIGGAALGFVLGGPAGAVQGAILGVTAGNLIFPPHLKGPDGPRLTDLAVSSSTAGTAIPFGYGKVRTGGNIIWSPGIQEHAVTTTESAKGGPTVSSTNYYYTASFAAAFGEGPGAILRIWGDTKVLYDPLQGEDAGEPDDWDSGTQYQYGDVVKYSGQYYFALTQTTAGLPPAIGTPAYEWQIYYWSAALPKYPLPTLYPGSQTQTADPAIQADQGAENTPAFRGLVYCVFEDLPLEDFGNRIPTIRAEVEYLNADGTSVTSVAEVAQDLCLRAGLLPAQVDVTQL